MDNLAQDMRRHSPDLTPKRTSATPEGPITLDDPLLRARLAMLDTWMYLIHQLQKFLIDNATVAS